MENSGITPEVVEKLLVQLVNPKYEGLIADYRIIMRQNPEGLTGVGIDVILNTEVYNDLDDSYGWENSVESQVESSIRKTMRYLQPDFVMVEFYVVDESGQ